MYKVYAAFAWCALLFCSSCFKGPKGFEEPQQVVTSDTLTSGDYWGIAVGDHHTDVYNKAKAFSTEKNISIISVPNNIFTDLATVKDKLPLYRSIFLDAATATPNGVQVYFENNEVKNIYNNTGQLLNGWPWNVTPAQAIKPADPVSGLYDKLVAIKAIPEYNVYFQRLSLFYKNIKTDYDPDMRFANKWFFVSPINDKVYLRVNLKFNVGAIVDSIMVDRVETL